MMRPVIPKLMTIAVNTSACGNGSAYPAASGERMGGAPVAKPPHEPR